MPDASSPDWWKHGVVYQVYPRSFADGDGDGTGDLAGVLARLDYLRDTLGIDAIWLSPFYPSPNADFGYDIADFRAVDPLFGDLPTFDRLVAAAHARDIRVIIDYVPNHSSIAHPWFRESRASRDNPRRDWYYWRDPAPGGGPPNNWLAIFGGPAWTLDDATGQYYLHTFLPEQPDLNWRNPDLKRAMLDVLRFWLDRDVDGIRMDAIHFLMKDPALRDEPPNPGAGAGHKAFGAYDSLLHIHTFAHPDVHPILREIRALVDGYGAARPRVTIGETHIFDWAVWSRYYGAALDELHLPFNFALLRARWAAPAVRAVVDGLEGALGALPPGAWPNYVLGNHDESRIASRVGRAGARLAMLLLLTLRGTPTLYYGDELGMEDVPVPPERVRDPWGLRVAGLGLGRDPERAPMPWDDSRNGGFCPPGVEPWLPVDPAYRERNVRAQRADPRSPLALTRALLRLRRAHPALHAGSYAPLDPTPADCFAYLRRAGDERFLVALNFAPEERTLLAPALGAGRCLLSTHLDRDDAVDLAALRLRPHEGCVIRLPA